MRDEKYFQDGSNTKSDAVLQSFDFPLGEVVMAIVERRRSVIKAHDDGKKVIQGAEAITSPKNESGKHDCSPCMYLYEFLNSDLM